MRTRPTVDVEHGENNCDRKRGQSLSL
jgi:hypothetical protein